MFRPFRPSLLFISCLLIYNTSIAQFNTLAQTQPSDQNYEKSIGDIGKKIANISQNLNANKALVAGERSALLKAEQKLYKLSEYLQKIDYELAKSEHEFEALTLQIAKVKRSQAGNSEALEKLLKSRFYNGKPDFLKQLLNQENPYAVGRLANYNKYFTDAFKQRFDTLREQAFELEKLNKDLAKSISTLKKDKEKQKEAERNVKNSKERRVKLITKLDQKIETNAQLLKKLKGDRERLKSLLNQLKAHTAELKRIEERKAREEKERQLKRQKGDQSSTPIKRTPVKGGFLKQKGRLSYPVEGEIIRGFGSRLPKSGMRSEGSFFNTLGSVSVKSIYRGRVLFADFLKGYGLLIIVDHGDDHISLYGHNDRLLKKVGDSVEINEVIAKSGVTGGLKSHGLYFEIRDNATPIDVSKWCR